MEAMYHVLSSRIQTEDEATDLQLQKRIKSLNWIMVQHLDINVTAACFCDGHLMFALHRST